MAKRILFQLMLVGAAMLLTGTSLHKYYVTITELEYDVDKKQYELSIRFIGHDLEHALEKANVPQLDLGTEDEHEKADEYLMKYIEKHFSLSDSVTILDLEFVGKEVKNDDLILIYVKSSETPPIEKLKIYNSLLTEVFDKQINYLHFSKESGNLSYRFTKTHVSETTP